MDVYANLGVQCAGTAAACTANLSNAFFHPDAFTADPLAEGNGLTGGVNFTALLLELAAAASGIPGLAFTATVDLSTDGKISADTTILLASGLNIIDIITDGNDFLLENSATLTIDGPADAFVIFRLDADAGKNFKISTGDIVIGGSGIGLNNVLFFLDGGRDFDFSNTFLNGVAFWTFGGESVDPALIVINDGTGCTQLVAEHINLNDVNLSRCAFISQNGTQVPLPATLLLVASGLGVGLALRAHRRRSSRPDQQVG